MSDLNLPEDPTGWPTSPSELLGVAYGASIRDLRRAYTRLIRLYKPEQYPEQFRRIREAYDSMLPFARSVESIPEAPTDSEPVELIPPPRELLRSADPAPGETAPLDQLPSLESGDLEPTERQPPPRRRLGGDIGELWESAVRGNLSTAYQELALLSHTNGGEIDIYQRLWWLLTCDPTLGRGDVPADWLVRGLRATGFAGPLRELYRDEIDGNPQEAFGERFSSLLAATNDVRLLAEFLEWRIQAATKTGDWAIIDSDLDRLGHRLKDEDERIWLRIVFAVADGVAWVAGGKATDLLRMCTGQIKRYEYLAKEFARSYDRFDWLLSFADGYRKLLGRDDISRDLLKVIRLGWNAPFAEIHPLLESIFDKIVRDPQRWVNYFDLVQVTAPAAIALFGQALDQYAADVSAAEPAAPDPDTALRLVRNYLPQSLPGGTLQWRRDRLLDLSLREALTIEQIAEVAAGLTGDWATTGNQFASEVLKDWPLRYVNRAWQLFWN